MAIIGYGFMNSNSDEDSVRVHKAMRGPARSMDMRYGLIPCWILMVLGTAMVGYAVFTTDWTSVVCLGAPDFPQGSVFGLWRICFLNVTQPDGVNSRTCFSTGSPLDLKNSKLVWFRAVQLMVCLGFASGVLVVVLTGVFAFVTAEQLNLPHVGKALALATACSATLVSIGLGTIYGRRHKNIVGDGAFSDGFCSDNTSIIKFGTSFTVATAGAVVNLIAAAVFIMISLCQRTAMTSSSRGLKSATKMFARSPAIDYGMSSMVVYNPSSSTARSSRHGDSKRFSASMWRDNTTLNVFNLHGSPGATGAGTSLS